MRQDNTPSIIHPPLPHDSDGSHHLVLIQQMWRELQATPKSSPEYQDLVERIRKAADDFQHRSYTPKPES